MNAKLRVLILEDRPTDAELVLRELRRAGYETEWKRVETEQDYLAELDRGWDVILADYNLPQFTGLRALELLKQRGLDIPFIIVSGTIGEDKAVEAMKTGASDYVMKDKLARLGTAVERELRQAIERHERRQSEEATRASELRYRRLFESARDGILILDADTGMIVDVNPFLIEMLGYPREDFLDKKVWELGFLKDLFANQNNFTELQQKGYVRYEDMPLKTSDGRRIEVEFVSNVYLVNHHKVIQCNIRDITERCVREKQEKLAMQVLAMLNRGNDVGLLVKDILHLIKESTGFEALGIRLREGDDFSYVETNGFPDHFVQMESHLCARDETGKIVRGEDGNPVLECMCGNVLRGRVDCSKPFFTKQGSFWTNSTTALLASTTEKDCQARTRNRCNAEGYESVALVPLQSGDKVIGLLQINDHRKGIFTIDMIRFFEEIGASIGIAVKRRRNAETLLEGEARYRTLFDDARDGIAIAEAETGRLVDCNQALCRLVERETADLVGQHQSVLHPPADLVNGQSSGFQEQLRAPGRLPVEDRLLSKSGKTIPVEVARTHVRLNGRDYLMGAFRDITERKQAEEERQHIHAQLLQAQKLESIGTLAGGVAHEINNPIMGIMGYAQLIQDKLGPDSPVAEYATEIGKETGRVATIVKNLLSFARLDKQNSGPARLHDIVEATLSLIRSVMRRDQVALDVDVPPDLPEIRCRTQQIQQVILNLLTNARDALNQKYPGHNANKVVRISARLIADCGMRNAELGSAEANRLQSEIRNPKSTIRITVEDHGAGIPEDLRARIFEPFFTTKPRDKGTGLGLSISYGIVKEHHGELSVESTVGEFTRFHVDLPVEGGGAAPDPGGDRDRRGAACALIVDDEEGIREIIRIALKQDGYEITTAADGDEALIRLRERRPDIVLLDLKLPRGSGVDVIREVRSLSTDIPVIIITGHTDMIQEALAYSPLVVLCKPIDTEALRKTVAHALRGHARTTGAGRVNRE